jgi:hypothetical protein
MIRSGAKSIRKTHFDDDDDDDDDDGICIDLIESE